MRTIKELAQTLDAVRGGDGAKTDYYLRHLRSLSASQIVNAADYIGHGKTATALYDEVGCVAAHYAMYFIEHLKLDTPSAYAATAAAIIGTGHRPFNAELLPPSQKHDGFYTPGDNIKAAIDGVRAGEEWSLFLKKTESHRFLASFRPVEYPVEQTSDRVKRALAHRSSPIAIITVEAKDFISVMLEKLD